MSNELFDLFYTQRIRGYQSVGFGWLSDFVSRDIDYKASKHCLSLVSFKEDFNEKASLKALFGRFTIP